MSELTVGGRRFSLRRASPEEIVDLRWRILRAGMPREEAVFAGDELETSFHYLGAEHARAESANGQRVVSCATFHLNQWEETPAYQLRGMATESDCRGFGLGKGLLELAQADVLAQTPVRLLWCNARTPALEFYRKQGWEVRTGVFEIPTAGPHVKMTKRI